jgi:hypothetical protein
MKYQSSIVSPPHWWGFDRWEDQLDCVVWTVVDNSGTVAPDTMTAAQLPLSPFCIPPGGSISGFQIVSRQPPGAVNWYAQAYDTLSSDEADPSNGLLPVEGTFFGLSITGTVTGPDLQSPTGIEAHGHPGSDLRLRWLGQSQVGRGGEFEFSLGRPSNVSLQIFDVRGRMIASLVHGYRAAGTYRATWSTANDEAGQIASGIYFALLEDGQGQRRTAKALIAK